jgi:hypothetical protein
LTLSDAVVRTPDAGMQVVARQAAGDVLFTVRAFYLDLTQRALDEPARWGPWAVPCPIRGSDGCFERQGRRPLRR